MKNNLVSQLFLLAIFAVLLHVAAMTSALGYVYPNMKPDCNTCIEECDLELPRAPVGQTMGSSTAAAPTVNHAATNEMKQQILRRRQPADCPTCPQVVPQYVKPSVAPVVIVPQQPAVRPVTPAPVAVPQQPSQVKPVAPMTSGSKYQIALFLDNSTVSQRLKSWFTNDTKLAGLKSKCEYQEYTAENALYKTRYARIVPVSQFPAVLFLKPDGGHIHAAGGQMIPGSADALYEDMREGYTLAKSVESAEAVHEQPGAIRETGYSWDASINPAMQLEQDCPDGFCPPTEQPGWRPGQRVADLFDRAVDSKEAIVWASAMEIAVFVLLGIVVLMAVAVAMKKGR